MKVEKSKKKLSLGLTTFAVICALIIVAAWLYHSTDRFHSFIVFGGGNPDSFGNQINMTKIYQDGAWAVTLIAGNYTEGNTYQIDANKVTHIQVQVYLNNTLADNATHAQSRTRVYLNVTGEFTNDNMNAISSGTVGSYYYVWYKATQNWTAATDTTYDVYERYEAYY